MSTVQNDSRGEVQGAAWRTNGFQGVPVLQGKYVELRERLWYAGDAISFPGRNTYRSVERRPLGRNLLTLPSSGIYGSITGQVDDCVKAGAAKR